MVFLPAQPSCSVPHDASAEPLNRIQTPTEPGPLSQDLWRRGALSLVPPGQASLLREGPATVGGGLRRRVLGDSRPVDTQTSAGAAWAGLAGQGRDGGREAAEG